MEAFAWDSLFATGIEIVDQQHRRLVDLVNEVGDLLLSGDTVSEGKLQMIFKQLADYARQHFADEEQLMREAGLDPRHIESHTRHHHQFIEQVASMWRARGRVKNPAEVVHGFLTAWLTFHILGEDQAMARQLALIQAGDAAQIAYEMENRPADKGTAALLDALHKLYHVIATQNHDLLDANARLEEALTERTRELAATRAQLPPEPRS